MQWLSTGLLIAIESRYRVNSRYRVDKSTIFGMRGLWGLTIKSGRGAMLKHLRTAVKAKKNKMAAFLGRKVIISASVLLRKAWLGSKLGYSGPRNPFM